MSSEPGNESFFCAFRPIPRILGYRTKSRESTCACYPASVHLPTSSPWAGWTRLRGSFLGDPVTAVNSSGTVQVFVRGSDGTVWTIGETAPGVFESWQGLGGYTISNPAVGLNSDGTLELFAVGGEPAAVVNSFGAVDLLWRASDTMLWAAT